jgi:hypothetical protein
MASLIRNKRGESLTLPFPYSGILPPGGSCVVPGTPAVVTARLGSQAGFAVDVLDVADSELLNNPVNGTYALPQSKLMSIGPIAAKGAADVHANLAGNAAVAFPGPFTSPVSPRNLRLTFAASYDGGNVTVTGTDQNGDVISEVFTGTAASTQVGVKVFKTVTAAVRSAVGATANVCSIGTGDKIGVGAGIDLAAGAAMLMVGATAEAVTLDATYDGFTPTTVPSATTYFLLANITTSLVP